MRSDATLKVAVIGGGFSGVMAAAQLARRGIAATIFDGGPSPGRGTAYGTDDPQHLLNVPAAKMSAWPDDPDHFRRWAGLAEGEFAQRMQFGRYLDTILEAQSPVTLVPKQVVSLEQAGPAWRLSLADDTSVHAEAVVLALGNEAPAVPAEWATVPLLANPWSPEANAALREVAESDGELLLVGTGLTAVDVMLTMAELGYAGRIVAVSRRGLLPRAHGPNEPAPVALDDLPLGNVLDLWRWLRRRSGEVGFRGAVDSLRPHSAAIWQSWSPAERRRFLRHARPWWDVHRHRIAPQVAEGLKQLIHAGQLEILAGRLVRSEDGGRLTVRRRDGRERTLTPALVVNCTGPLGDVRRSANPLLRQLIDDGLVGTDPLDIGLLADENDRVADRLWAVGPLTKGMYWEMTAVPDIRHQVDRVASAIAKELAPHG